MTTKASAMLGDEYMKIIDYCNKSGAPVFLDGDGNDAVMISMAQYEKYERMELRHRIKCLEEDIREGKTISAEKVFANLRAKLAALKEQQ